MPTYEHVVDGQVVERSQTLAEHPFDAQMAALVEQPDSGWRRVDPPVTTPSTPVEAAPAPDAEVPPQAAPTEPAAEAAPVDAQPVAVGEPGPEPFTPSSDAEVSQAAPEEH